MCLLASTAPPTPPLLPLPPPPLPDTTCALRPPSSRAQPALSSSGPRFPVWLVLCCSRARPGRGPPAHQRTAAYGSEVEEERGEPARQATREWPGRPGKAHHQAEEQPRPRRSSPWGTPARPDDAAFAQRTCSHCCPYPPDAAAHFDWSRPTHAAVNNLRLFQRHCQCHGCRCTRDALARRLPGAHARRVGRLARPWSRQRPWLPPL